MKKRGLFLLSSVAGVFVVLPLVSGGCSGDNGGNTSSSGADSGGSTSSSGGHSDASSSSSSSGGHDASSSTSSSGGDASSSSSGGDASSSGGHDASSSGGDASSSGGDASSSSGGDASSSSGGDASSSSGGDAGCVNLTVHNFASWCNVSIAGGTFTNVEPDVVCVTPGTITLVEEPLNGTFTVGLFHGTSGDTGSGDPGTCTGTGTSEQCTTTVVVGSAAKCVWVCCPFASNGTGCNVANQCP
jgi:hypothetical protein